MILIIDNYDSFTYNLYQAIALHHDEVRIIRNDKISLEEIKRMNPSGIIISPGPGRPEDAGICVDLVHAIVKGDLQQIPILGVCLGHQVITIALGGRVIQAQEIFHGKQDLIFHDQKGIYQSATLPFAAGRYHSLISDRDSLPSSIIIEAENNHQLIMGIRHVTLPLFGVQFHPESILTPEGITILREFIEICEQHAGVAA